MTLPAPPTTTAAIAAALAEFQAEMPTVAKSKKAEVPTKAGGKYTYTYAGLAEVTDAAMPILHKNGLAFSCCPQRGDHGYEIVGLLLHTSGESLTASLPLHGNQAQDIGSSLTYARRYLLGCMTGLVTDDDDDGNLAQAAKRTVAPITAKTRATMFKLFEVKGVTEDRQLEGINRITGGSYTSRGDLSEADAKAVVAALQQRPDAPPAPAQDVDPLASVETPARTDGATR